MKCRVDSAGYLLTLKQSQGERYWDRYRCPVSVLRVTFCHRGCQAMVEGDGFVRLTCCNATFYVDRPTQDRKEADDEGADQ